MKKLLLAPALLLAMTTAKAQLALQNFNSAGIPAGWTMINVDGKTISSTLNARIVTGLATAAWMKWPVTTTDSMMITTSLFTPAGTCDRWLITPSFNVTSADMMIAWFDNQPYSAAGLTDNIQVWVSTTGGATVASFTTNLGSSVPAAGTSKKRISLSAFNGQNIRIAFRSTGTNAGVVGIDNVQTEIATPLTDLQLSTVTPSSGSLASYNTTGSPISFGGTVTNNGTGMVSSYTVKYQVGTGTVVSETKSLTSPILSLASANFTFTATAPAPAANTATKVWVELASDAVKTNDTLNTNIAGYTTKPTKKILGEQGTGTWCQWCPRGHIFMDSIHKMKPNNWSLVAVHNGDPMTVSAYDSYIGGLISGYPSMVYDRRLTGDPGGIFSVDGTESTKFGVADLTLTPTVAGSNVTIKVDVLPRVSTNADYRLALVLTENRVKGTTSTYNQANAYSGGASGAMKNAEFNFATLPNPVPAATMRYDYVARGIYPSPTGAAGSLPMMMTSATSYSYTFPAVTISSTSNINQMYAVVMLINNADGSVLNTNNIKLTNVSIKETVVGVNDVDVYPNPANEVVTTKFSLTEQSNVSIEIVDMLGKVVKTVANKSLTAGTYEVPTNIAELASGVYLVKITTDNGTTTERLSIAK
jgi:hypothetical protein